MNNEKKLDGALCADVGTADAAAAEAVQAAEVQAAEAPAPAEGKKKYVPPTMQVIPLGPQRMLATSGQALSARIFVTPLDYYLSDDHNPPYQQIYSLNFDLCGNTANGAWAAQAGQMAAYHAEFLSESASRNHDTSLVYPLDVGLTAFATVAGPTAEITGANLASQDFLSSAVIQCDGSGGYYGTYMGQSFTVELIYNYARQDEMCNWVETIHQPGAPTCHHK